MNARVHRPSDHGIDMHTVSTICFITVAAGRNTDVVMRTVCAHNMCVNSGSGGASSRCKTCVRAKRGRCGTEQAGANCLRRGQAVNSDFGNDALLNNLLGAEASISSFYQQIQHFILL